MGEFFGSIYCWAEDFFGLDLAEYLWGTTGQDGTNKFIGIGMSMLAISLVVMIVYYYIVNHPRLNNWWGWSIFLAVNAVVNLIVGLTWVLKDKYEGLMTQVDPSTGELVELPIAEGNIAAFGVTNMINSIIAFVVLSYICKWWSTNCSRAPF